MRYVADLAEADIAKALGISRSTVSSTLTDAHRALKLSLSDPWEPRPRPLAPIRNPSPRPGDDSLDFQFTTTTLASEGPNV